MFGPLEAEERRGAAFEFPDDTEALLVRRLGEADKEGLRLGALLVTEDEIILLGKKIPSKFFEPPLPINLLCNGL